MTLRKVAIKVEAGGGATITEALAEALIMSAKEKAPVTLEFNGTAVTLDADPVLDRAYRAWFEQRPK